MGNTGSTQLERIQGLSASRLSKTSREDDEIALKTEELFQPEYLKNLKDLSTYEIPFIPERKAPSEDQGLEEVKFGLTHNSDNKLQERHKQLRKTLQCQIFDLLFSEEDPDLQDLQVKLQTLSRIQDALIRQEERERRRLQKSSQSSQEKSKKKKKELPLPAQIGLQFGLETLLLLVREVGSDRPRIFSSVINLATSVLTQLPPLSLNLEEPTILKGLDSIKNFLESLLNGETYGCSEADSVTALVPLFGLALAKGDLSSALAVAKKFLDLKDTEALPGIMILPLLKNLAELEGSGVGRKVSLNWNSNRVGPDIALSNENTTVTRTDSSGWGCQLTEQSLTSGIHYYEFKIERNNSSCLLLGVAGSQFSNFSSKSSGPHCYTLQSDGDAYMNDRSSGNVFRYGEGDRLGLLINMEDKNLTFFLNGRKQSKPSFSPLPEEVYLIACFGGSNQFVTLVNDPEIPEEAQEAMGSVLVPHREEEEKKEFNEEDHKQGEEVELFPSTPSQVLAASRFKNIFSKSELRTSSQELSVFILTCLDKLNSAYFEVFRLNEKPSSEPIKAKLSKQQPLCLEIKREVFQMLSSMLRTVVNTLREQKWEKMDFHLTVWAGISILRLLRSHLFTVLFLQLEDSETGMSQELRESLYGMLQEVLELEIANFGNEQPTREDFDALNVIKKESSLTLIHGFEVFYPTQVAKLDYINKSLEDTKAKKKLHDIHLNIQQLVFDKMSVPVNLSAAFTLEPPETPEKVEKLLELLLDICAEYSLATINGSFIKDNSYYLKFLNSAQKVLLSKAARNNFKGTWQQLLIKYTQKVFNTTQKLLDKLKVGDQDPEERGKRTVLESLVSTLILSLCLSQPDLEFLTSLIQPLMNIVNAMNSLTSQTPTLKNTTRVTQETYESSHPPQANDSRLVSVPNAFKYILRFDPQCKLEGGSLELWLEQDKQTKVAKWEGSDFPFEPFVVEAPQLYFEFTGDTSSWGWKVEVEAEVETEQKILAWTHHLRTSANFLMVLLSKELVKAELYEEETEELKKLWKNSLFKFGIKDKCQKMVMPKSQPKLNEGVIDLTIIPGSVESLGGVPQRPNPVAERIRKSSLPSFKPAETNPSISLAGYIASYSASTASLAQYSENMILEEWIAGSERVRSAWDTMRKQAGVKGPAANIGGADMEQAERAVFGVYAVFFEFSETLGGLIENPKETGDSILKHLIYQAVQIRKWAQEQKQSLIDQGKDTDYFSISKEIVRRCTVLIHSEYKQAMNEIGVDSILIQLMPSLRRAQTTDVILPGSKGPEAKLREKSKWKSVQQAMGSVKKLKTLLKIISPESSQDSDQDKEKAEFKKVNKLVYEFLESPVTIEQMFESLEKRRNKALTRAIGINYFVHMFKFAFKSHKCLKGQVVRAFSDSFRNSKLSKKHYLAGLEGVDSNLQNCVQRSFFNMYSLLISNLRISELYETDCTSHETTHNYLKIIEALSFPFEDSDSVALLGLNMHESLNFLLTWAKGLKINERVNYKFDPSACITTIKVHNEEELQENLPENSECFSLNSVNRLDGDVGDEGQGGLKLCMEIIRGETEALPIIEIHVGTEAPEDFQKIEGNVNEIGEPAFLFVKRSEPKDGNSYLVKLEVTEENPIVLRPTYTPYNKLLVKEQDEEESKNRQKRKKALREAVWALFKHLAYTCASKPENKISNYQEIKKLKLQTMFAEIMLEEVSWMRTKERIDLSTKELANLHLKKVSSGEFWIQEEIKKPKLQRNPMMQWVTQFRQAFKHLYSEGTQNKPEETELMSIVELWISKIDPSMKGCVDFEEVEGIEEADELKSSPNCKNSRGQIDFFTLIYNGIKEIAAENPNSELLQHPLIKRTPCDFYTASQEMSLDFEHVIRFLKQEVSPDPENSVMQYIKAIEDCLPTTPGTVPHDKVPRNTPPEFMNSSKDLDLFALLNAVRCFPEAFPTYHEELSLALSAYYELPSSVEELNSIQSQTSSTSDYSASLLWVLYQTSCSQSMRKVLSKPAYIEELVKHMLLGANDTIIVIAFRIVKSVLPTQHSPQSFQEIWKRVPRESLDRFLDEKVKESWLDTLLALVGMKNSYHILPEKEFVPNLSRIGIWSNEATELLKSLCMKSKWKQEINFSLLKSTKELVSSINEGNYSALNHVGLGALSFLCMCTSNYFPLDKSVQEWSFATLKGGSLPHGHIVSLNPRKGMMRVFSTEDDSIREESINNLNHMVSLTRPNVFSGLDPESTQQLFGLLNQMITVIKHYENHPVVEEIEKLHAIRTMWRQLECQAYQVLSSITASKVLYDESEAEKVAEFVFSRVSETQEGDLTENSLRYRHLRMLLYSKYKHNKVEQLKKAELEGIEITEEKEEPEEFSYMTEEEERKIIASMNEEQQILLATTESLGYSFKQIHSAMQEGNNSVEAITDYIESRRQQEDKKAVVQTTETTCVYKLSKEDEASPSFIDHTGIAHFEETKSGHFLITSRRPLDEKKYMKKTVSSKVFRNVSELQSEISLLAALSGDAVFGFVVGGMEVTINQLENEAVVLVGEEVLTQVPKAATYEFRVFVKFNGSVVISLENTELTFNRVDYSIYDGLTIGEFGLFLQEGEKAELKGFAICLGHYTGKFNYFEEEKPKEQEEAKEKSSSKRLVEITPIEKNQTALRLKTTGAPDEVCEKLASEYVSFDKALEVLLSSENSENWSDSLETFIEPALVELGMVENPEDIEEGYSRVPLFVEGADRTHEFSIPNRKILTYKQHKGSSAPGAMITNLAFSVNSENKEDLNIGNLTASSEEGVENKIWVTKLGKNKLGSRQPITKVILIATREPSQMHIPTGFEIVHQDNRAVNIAPDNFDFYVFLAFTRTSFLLGFPVTPFIYSKVTVSEHGLVESLEGSQAEADMEKMKKIEEEIQNYSQLSIIELQSQIKKLDEFARTVTMKNFFSQLIQSYPNTLPYIVNKNPKNFNMLYNLLKDNTKVLEATLIKVLQGPYGAQMAKTLLQECILQLVLASTCAAPTGKLSEQIIESAHPYENNMRHDQTIQIPGAAGLRIEFDPQCHTESGCDILRFFRQPNHQGQICEYSGRNFQELEVEGDTVNLYFYTDSSCVEWGYKFRVIPIEPEVASNNDPLLHRMNTELALWVLEKLILSMKEIPLDCFRFMQKELLNPLTVFVHACKDINKQERGIRVIQRILRKREETVPSLQRIVDLITEETRALYNFEKGNKGHSSLLQKLVSLITELKSRYHINLEERWFHEICDAFSLMKGFCNRDENIYPILFEQFRIANKISPDKNRESSHPYSKKFTTKEVSIKGASFLEIEFDERSLLDSHDAIMFSYDRAGLEPVEDSSECSLNEAAWTSDPHGPDVTFSNSNRSVTRTNSSGWGCALWSESYSQGRVKVTFHIDNDGRSDYLYIGIFKADGNYRLNEVINSDNSHDLWTWKTTGEFHKRGEKITNQEARYRSGDTISMLINMEERNITFAKNGVDMHTFNEVAEEVIPVICFGGSNQHVSIVSVESYLAAFNKISKKKVLAKSDQVFFHFPVNCGYMMLSMHTWKKPAVMPNHLAISQDSRRAKTISSFEGRSVQLTGLTLQAGKHYCDFTVAKLNEASRLQIGVVPAILDKQIALVKDNTVCYQVNGSVFFGTNEKQAEPLVPGDKLGVLFDVEKSTVGFYKNTVEVASGNINIEGEQNYVFGVSFSEEGEEVLISKEPQIPEEVDIIGFRKEAHGSEGNSWGYKFKVTPFYTGENKMKVIECLNPKQMEQWNKFVEKHLNNITKFTEEQLVQYIDELCNSEGKDPLKLEVDDIKPSPEDLRHFHLLENLSLNDIKDMFRIIAHFNRQVEKILPLISLDLSSSSRRGLDEIQTLFLSTRGYIFFHLKNEMFKQVLNSTKTESRPEISIDRTKAMRHKYSGKVDSQALVSVFGQLYRNINKNSPRSFRNPERIFKVVFKGEGSTDAGGPYNEVMSTICDELMSKFIPLFIPSQNNVHNVGDNRDAWLINPIANNTLHIDLFQFLGKLMGVAIRTQNNLNLTLPPLFWKRLMIEEVTVSDLKGVDECCFQMLEILRNLDEQGITSANFSEAFENLVFTATDSSGRNIELLEGGREIPVTYYRAIEYAKLVENLRLVEGEEQYAAIRKGLSIVVPLNLLNLFSWKQVETMVCGAPDIDVDMLISKTEYENISSDDRQVQFFWQVLREITPKDRSQFLRFVWGRSRLPAGREFKRFKVTALNKGGNPDNYLPVAHTCFFQIDIPAYSSKEIMREKLLYAITHCQAIDLDRVAEGGWEEET